MTPMKLRLELNDLELTYGGRVMIEFKSMPGFIPFTHIRYINYINNSISYQEANNMNRFAQRIFILAPLRIPMLTKNKLDY